MASFNCGKMTHIFEAANVGKQYRYSDVFTSEDAKYAFLNSKMKLKVHGECCCLVKDDGKYQFYMRRDNHRGTTPCIPLPTGLHTDTYTSGTKAHHYTLVHLLPDTKTRNSTPGPSTYAAIRQGISNGVLPDPAIDQSPDHISCEWMGIKHQGNSENFKHDHVIVPHHSLPTVAQNVPRTFQAMEDYAGVTNIEGAVLTGEHGRRYKLRFDMFKNNAWKMGYPETTIKPTVFATE